MQLIFKQAKIGWVALAVIILIIIFSVLVYIAIYKGLANAFNL